MDTVAFAYNRPSETVFYCIGCAKEQFGPEPHTEAMMVNEHTEMEFIKCDHCGSVVRDN